MSSSSSTTTTRNPRRGKSTNWGNRGREKNAALLHLANNLSRRIRLGPSFFVTRFGVWRKKNYFVLRAPVSSSWPLRGNTTKIIKIKEKSLWLLNCFEYISTRVKQFFCITLLCRQTHFRRMKAIYKREWWTASTKQRSWMKRYEKKRFFFASLRRKAARGDPGHRQRFGESLRRIGME